jgi:hypothetical protein
MLKLGEVQEAVLTGADHGHRNHHSRRLTPSGMRTLRAGPGTVREHGEGIWG